MTKPKETGPIRTNLGELKQKIVETVGVIKDAKADRAESNTIIAEQIASMEAKGIPRKAIQWAMAYAEWDADARAGFDAAYTIVREAIGLPMADELFDAEGNPNLNIPAIKEEDDKRKGAASDADPAQPALH